MDIKTALDTAFNASTQFHSFEKLSTFLDPSIIDEAFVATPASTKASSIIEESKKVESFSNE